MKGKNKFTQQEIATIKRLITEKCRATTDKQKQKQIRAKIRRIGFYYEDFFGAREEYTIERLDELIRAERIMIVGDNEAPSSKLSAKAILPTTITKMATPQRTVNAASCADATSLEKTLMNERDFKSAGDIDALVTDAPGLYCIRIKEPSKLSKLFRDALAEREHNIIYIGIASQSLSKRFLGQELRARGHGTFFRSIGAVTGYRPPKGSLKNKANKRNYTFAAADEQKIIEWINENLMVNWVVFNGDYESIETSLIAKYKPLLNIAKNPAAIQAVKDLRKECVDIANS